MALSQIRAAVEVTYPVVGVESAATGGTASVTQVSAQLIYTLPLAALQYITITYGAELDYRGMNKLPKEFQFVLDSAHVTFNKARADAVGTVDLHTLLVVKKNPSDPVHSAETRTASIAKPLSDRIAATDDLYGMADADDQETMWLAKSIPAEAQHVADVQHSAFNKPFTEPKTALDVRTASISKAKTDAAAISEIRTNSINKPLADSVDAGDELNGSFATDDGETMFMVKSVSDSHSVADVATDEFGKVADELVPSSDTLWPFDMSKAVTDTAISTDPYATLLEKPAVDAVAHADLTPVTVYKQVSDHFNGQLEGPNSFPDYFAQDYALDRYAATGIPAFDLGKARADSFATADAQTHATGKQLNEAFQTASTLLFGTALTKADGATTAESRIYGIAKPLSDAVGKSDAASKGTDKALADSKATSDSATDSFGKALVEYCAQAEYVGRSVVKSVADAVHPTDDFLGAANADDDQTMSFATSRSETVVKSDANSLGTGKQLADTAGKSDSGSFRMTSYCDVNYFTSDFVGIASTF